MITYVLSKHFHKPSSKCRNAYVAIWEIKVIYFLVNSLLCMFYPILCVLWAFLKSQIGGCQFLSILITYLLLMLLLYGHFWYQNIKDLSKMVLLYTVLSDITTNLDRGYSSFGWFNLNSVMKPTRSFYCTIVITANILIGKWGVKEN